MKIPKDAVERKIFYTDILRQCTASRADRMQFNAVLKNYMLFGTKDTQGAYYNKIYATVDTLWSFMYSSDTAKFAIHLGTESTKSDLAKTPPLVAEINDQWKASRANLVFSSGGIWSLVYGSMLFKTLWQTGKAKTYTVEPHQFGVYREDIMELDDQEAFVHCYQITRTQLANMLEGNPRKKEIIAATMQGSASATSKEEGNVNDGLGRLILSSGVGLGGASGNSPIGGGGNIDGGIGAVAGGQYNYVPRVEAELIDMYELSIWNDEIEDYQIVTFAQPGIVVFDRPNFYIEKNHPYTNLVPEQGSYDYFWGTSFVARLTGLQEWREERIQQIKALLEKQMDPPAFGVGLTGIADEKFQALGRAGGRVSSTNPSSKVEFFHPEMPSNTFAELSEIDSMFADLSGITSILQGHGGAGVRSHGQADLMARLGSSRVKQRALVTEEAAARLGTKILRTVQEYSDQRFFAAEPGPDGQPLPFVAKQFTNDYDVQVDSHSSSPVFVEDSKQMAEVLLKSKSIDRSTFLDMMDPPNKQLLQEKLKKIEAQEAEAQKVQLQLAEQKVAGKAGHK